MQQFKEDPGPYEWGVARPRKAVRRMPSEHDARETVRVALETWGPGIAWRVMYRKIGGGNVAWSEAT